MDLFPDLVVMMRQDSSTLEDTAYIAKAYIEQGRESFLQIHGVLLADILESSLGSLGDKGSLMMTDIAATLLKQFPADGPRLIARSLARMLQDVQPEGQESSIVKGGYASLFARIWLTNPAFLQEFLQGIGPSADPTRAYLSLFDALFSAATKIEGLANRRLIAAALSAVASTPGDEALSRLPAALQFSAAVVAELEMPNSDPYSLGQDYWIAQGEPEEDSSFKDTAEQLVGADILSQLDLKCECRRRLEEAAAVHGREKVEAAVAAAGPSVAAALNKV